MTTSKPIKKSSRYDQEHLTRSFRLKTRESNERLQAYLEATGGSLSGLIERILDSLPPELPDAGKIEDAAYAQGHYEGYEDGYERARGRMPYPPNLMTRRAREQAIEVFKRSGRLPQSMATMGAHSAVGEQYGHSAGHLQAGEGVTPGMGGGYKACCY